MSNLDNEVRSETPSEELFEEAYNALLPKFEALGSAELEPINLDIPSMVTTALGVAPEVAAFEDRDPLPMDGG